MKYFLYSPATVLREAASLFWRKLGLFYARPATVLWETASHFGESWVYKIISLGVGSDWWWLFMFKKNEQIINAFLSWLVGNLLGWIFISALLVVLPILKSVPGFFAPLLILTIPIGFAQWLVLHRFIPLSLIWVITILIGCLLSFLIFAAIPESLWQIVDDEATATITFMYTIMGATIGLSQWPILRRKFTKAVLWILGSSLGLGFGFGLVLATGLINRSEFVSYTIIVLVYGIATGLTLSWLLRYELRRPTATDSAPLNGLLKQTSDSGKI